MTHISPLPRSLRYVGAIGCAIVILYGSVIDPGDGVPRTLFGIGFTVYLHFIAYAGFTGALCYAVLSTDRRTLLVAATVAALYGIAVELVQATIPYRTMSALDILINAAGATAGAAWWWLVAPWFGADGGDQQTAEA
ncbi:MAG: VanZ family protein [Halobacteriota archaeon]|uniref:VanZ family protein n=1 Tax=Natronomonas sp. TaxID=2184060 RepID=UPI00397529A7